MKSSLSRVFCLSAALGLAVLSASGCRTDPNQVLMEQEHRCLEDKIFDLQGQLDDCKRQLESCQSENSTLKKDGSTGEAPTETTPSRTPKPPPADIFKVPQIDLGTPDQPGNTPPGSTSPPSDAAPPADKPTEQPPAGADKPSRGPRERGPSALEPSNPPDAAGSAGLPVHRVALTGDPATVDRIVINRFYTGGHSVGAKSADDGLIVVFNPRDASGRPVKAAGEVSMVAIDPAAKGGPARVARWDFPAPEVADHYHDSAILNGFQFILLWPSAPPEHGELKLFVRFTTADGRRFEADQAVHVKLAPSDSQTTWSKPSSPQQWEPAQLPIGAQFDPNAESPSGSAVAPTDRAAAKTPTTPPDQDPEAAAPPRRRGATWSPYR